LLIANFQKTELHRHDSKESVELLQCLLPAEISIALGIGTKVYFDPRHSIGARLKDRGFGWSASFTVPQGAVPIATNALKQPVAFEMQIGKGLLVVLPRYGREEATKSEVVKSFVGYVESKGPHGSLEPPPPWVEHYSLYREEEVRQNLKASREWLQKVDRLKALLYGAGADLLDAVELCLIDFRFTVRNIEREAQHDLEVIFPDTTIIAEVSGKKEQLGAPGMRELIDHYLRAVELESASGGLRRFKGVFFLNAHRGTEPRLRTDPLTQHAKETAERMEFAVVPTPLLYELYSRYIQNLATAETVERILMDTKGLLRLP
jgi:hypothetical protein